jgi:hypothetical protein
MRGLSRSSLLLAAMIVVGCSSLRSAQLGPEPRSLSATSWIVLKSGDRIELRDGRVTPDSVIGIQSRLHRAIPRDSVVSVEERVSPSPVPLAMLGALVAGVVVLVTTQN